MPSSFRNHLHCLFVRPIVIPLPVELFSPTYRRDIAILMHRFVRNEMKQFADRCPSIHIRSMIKKQPDESSVPLATTQIRIVHNTSKQGCMPAEAVLVNVS